MAKKATERGLFRRGGIWYCRVFGEKKSTGCRDKTAARSVWAELERRAADPVYAASQEATVARAAALTVIDVRDVRKKSADTVSFYEKKLGHLVRIFGADTKLATFRDGRPVDEYIKQRRKEGVVDHTISKELKALGMMLRVAKRAGLWAGDTDAIIPIAFSAEYTPRTGHLLPSQIRGLLDVLPERWARWVALAIATGARKSELEAMVYADFSGRIAKSHGKKTRASRRDIWVPELYTELLAFALGEGGDPDEPVVGKWSNATRDLAHYCAKAGQSRVTPNDLRRTHGKLLHLRGVSLTNVARSLRHTDDKMARKVYAQLTAEELGGLIDQELRASQMRPSESVISVTDSPNPPISLVSRGRIELPTRGFSGSTSAYTIPVTYSDSKHIGNKWCSVYSPESLLTVPNTSHRFTTNNFGGQA